MSHKKKIVLAESVSATTDLTPTLYLLLANVLAQ